MTRLARIGLIGAGPWGRTIIAGLRGMPDIVLARLASTNAASAGLVPASCVVSTDWRRVASAEDLDGVIVATPPRLHPEMAMVALRAGLGVLVEKPMALSMAEAAAMIELARERGTILQVDHIDLFNPAWNALGAHLSELGGIVSVEASFGGPGPFRDDVAPRWDWGCHPIALCLDLLGGPSEVRARHVFRRRTERGLLEEIQMEMDFPNGATAQVTTSNALGERRRRIAVSGRHAALIYDDNAQNKLVRADQDGQEPLAVETARPLDRVLARFANSLRAGGPDWRDAVLGLGVVEVLERVDQALAVHSRAGRQPIHHAGS